jgi:hypothetical protein
MFCPDILRASLIMASPCEDDLPGLIFTLEFLPLVRLFQPEAANFDLGL